MLLWVPEENYSYLVCSISAAVGCGKMSRPMGKEIDMLPLGPSVTKTQHIPLKNARSRPLRRRSYASRFSQLHFSKRNGSRMIYFVRVDSRIAQQFFLLAITYWTKHLQRCKEIYRKRILQFVVIAFANDYLTHTSESSDCTRTEIMVNFLQNTEKDGGRFMKKYVCSVCGYEYDGEVPFEQLDDDYVCPVCGVGKDLFAEE